MQVNWPLMNAETNRNLIAPPNPSKYPPRRHTSASVTHTARPKARIRERTPISGIVRRSRPLREEHTAAAFSRDRYDRFRQTSKT